MPRKQAWMWRNKHKRHKSVFFFLLWGYTNTCKKAKYYFSYDWKYELMYRKDTPLSQQAEKLGSFQSSSHVAQTWGGHRLNNKPVSAFFFLQLRWYMVGSSTILIDTCGNYSSGRQQTVAIQGQWKSINHRLWFRLPARGWSRSTKKQFCQHVFGHLSS